MITADENVELLTNKHLISNIWDTLKKEAVIRSWDLGSLSIEVKGTDVYLIGYLPQEDALEIIESLIVTVFGVVEIHNHLVTNENIQTTIWDELRKVESIRTLDLGSLDIGVKNGEVFLYGHIAKESNVLQINSIAQSVAGVVAVHNHLIFDGHLILQVAQALNKDERIRPFNLSVNASHGWIHIHGVLPDYELQQLVEKVAAGVPNVRGVVGLPWVAGEGPNLPRHAIQPRIGAVVYGKNGEVGIVTQVVIQPNNRLVTHFVVRSIVIQDTHLVARKNVLPVDDIELVRNESVFLVRNGPSFNSYPTFDPDEYSLAPSTWKPPYPYQTITVIWSPKKYQHGEPQPEIKPETETDEAGHQVMVLSGV